LDFFANAQKPLHSYKILALVLSLPVTFLAWAAITFAAAIIVLAWKGLDTTFIGTATGVTDYGNAGSLRYGLVTSWVTTVAMILLVIGILTSYVFFLRVSEIL
jgi:hypothetical protein